MEGLHIDYNTVALPNRLDPLKQRVEPVPATPDQLGLVLVVPSEQLTALEDVPKGEERVQFIGSPDFIQSIKAYAFLVNDRSSGVCTIVGADSESFKIAIAKAEQDFPDSTLVVAGDPGQKMLLDLYLSEGFNEPYLEQKLSEEPLLYLQRGKTKDISVSSVSNEIQYLFGQVSNDTCTMEAQLQPEAVSLLQGITDRPDIGNEMAGNLYCTETKPDMVHTFDIEPGSVIQGKREGVKIAVGLYNFHSHPKVAYTRHKVTLAWPSAQDYVGYLLAYLDDRTIFHLVAGVEGVYILSITPFWLRHEPGLSDKAIPFIKEKYNFCQEEGQTVDWYLQRISDVEYQGGPIFDVQFLPWDRAGDVFTVSFAKQGANCFSKDRAVEGTTIQESGIKRSALACVDPDLVVSFNEFLDECKSPYTLVCVAIEGEWFATLQKFAADQGNCHEVYGAPGVPYALVALDETQNIASYLSFSTSESGAMEGAWCENFDPLKALALEFSCTGKTHLGRGLSKLLRLVIISYALDQGYEEVVSSTNEASGHILSKYFGFELKESSALMRENCAFGFSLQVNARLILDEEHLGQYRKTYDSLKQCNLVKEARGVPKESSMMSDTSEALDFPEAIKKGLGLKDMRSSNLWFRDLMNLLLVSEKVRAACHIQPPPDRGSLKWTQLLSIASQLGLTQSQKSDGIFVRKGDEGLGWEAVLSAYACVYDQELARWAEFAGVAYIATYKDLRAKLIAYRCSPQDVLKEYSSIENRLAKIQEALGPYGVSVTLLVTPPPKVLRNIQGAKTPEAIIKQLRILSTGRYSRTALIEEIARSKITRDRALWTPQVREEFGKVLRSSISED